MKSEASNITTIETPTAIRTALVDLLAALDQQLPGRQGARSVAGADGHGHVPGRAQRRCRGRRWSGSLTAPTLSRPRQRLEVRRRRSAPRTARRPTKATVAESAGGERLPQVGVEEAARAARRRARPVAGSTPRAESASSSAMSSVERLGDLVVDARDQDLAQDEHRRGGRDGEQDQERDEDAGAHAGERPHARDPASSSPRGAGAFSERPAGPSPSSAITGAIYRRRGAYAWPPGRR